MVLLQGGSQAEWTYSPGPTQLGCLRLRWTGGLCPAPPPVCPPPTGSTEFPERPRAGWSFKASLDAPTLLAVGEGQGMGVCFPQERDSCILEDHSIIQGLRDGGRLTITHRGTNKFVCRLTAAHRKYRLTDMNTHRLHTESPGHGSHTLTAAQGDLILQASSPTASDPTRRTQSDTEIGSYQATVDSLTSLPTDSQPHPREPPGKSHTDSQPHTKYTDKSDFIQPTLYTGPVSPVHASRFRWP